MAEPAVTRRPVDGWDHADLEGDRPLGSDHRAAGCDLSESERLWSNARDGFDRLMWELRDGRRLPGFRFGPPPGAREPAEGATGNGSVADSSRK